MTDGRSSAPVPPGLYDEAMLTTFAAGEHQAFLAGGGRSLRPRLQRSFDLAALRPGNRLVDIGCGRGEAAAHAALRGARVIALDFSPDALRMTRRTAGIVAGGHGVGRDALRVMPVAGEASALPLASGSADRVLILDVVEHLRPWQLAALLAEVHRILAPGGLVVIHTLPNAWALALSYPVLRRFAPALPAEPRSKYESAVHVNEQSPLSMRGALRDAGFRSRVWVEEWSTRQAAIAEGRRYPDLLRDRGYAVLRRPIVARIAERLMESPLGPIVGNDIFALAWIGSAPPHPGLLGNRMR